MHVATVDAALQIDTVDLSPSARQELLEQHVALVEDGLASKGPEAASSALALAETHASRYDYTRAIELARLAIAWSGFPRDHAETLEMRSRVVTWLDGAGRVEDAERQLQKLLPDTLRVLGPTTQTC